jgi:predicted signal transduction protein with EAL and GGDEF domain
MARTPGGPQWRGWDATESGTPGLVTSTRLGAGAPVQNRMFPKVRSWFALGAPLELLSPLSVARILLLLLAAVAAVVLGAPGVRVVPTVVVLVVAIGLLVALVRVKELGPRDSQWVAAGVTLAIGALVWACDGRGAAVASVMVLVAVAIFVGMFSTMRALLAQQALVLATVLVSLLVTGRTSVDAIFVAGLTFVATTATALTVSLTSAAARRKAMIDADTGIPNGYGFAEEVNRRLGGGPVVVAALVLGGLAEAREALGHRAATELLRRAVEDLGQVVPADARIGRVDGDELMVVQSLDGAVAADGHDAAVGLARHLADGIGSGRYLFGTIEVMLRPVVGLVVGPADGRDATELIRHAALAARRAHSSGQAHVRWDETITDVLTSADLALLTDLRLAASRGELWVAYQPQIDPRDGATVAVEALLRWSSPIHGVVPPDRFVPLAERTGLVDRLTDFVLGEALDAQVRWRRVGLRLPVSVNVSAVSLSAPELPAKILEELRTRRLPGDVLTVEVTETAALDAERAADRLGALSEAGVEVSIDDFGTGYTSLSVLPFLPVSELKVDQRFVKASATSPADDAIVRSVLELAHQLGLRAVAEGVEDGGTAARLGAYGFDRLQGWAFAPALAEPDLVDFVCRAPHAAATGPASAPAEPAAPAPRAPITPGG